MNPRTAIDECLSRAAPAGSDLYYATLHLEPSLREPVLALLALAAEVAGIPRNTSDPGVARIRLAWWQEELERLQEGAPRHPISIALQATGAAPTVDAAALRTLVDAASRWLDARNCPDLPTTVAAHRRFEGEWWRCVALLTGADAPDMQAAAASLGTVVGMFGTLASLREHIRAGTARLPADALSRHRLTIDDLAGAPPAIIREVATTFADETTRLADAARAELAGIDATPLLPHWIMTEIACRTLNEIRDDGFAMMQRRIVLTPLRKIWIALMVRRRCRRHRR